MSTSNLAVVRAYLADIAAGVVGNALSVHFTPDMVQVEYPNKLNPQGGRSDLATLLARSVQGQRVLSAQSYRILSETSEGDRVAVEAEWTGTLAIALGTLAPGAQMRAHFAMFFEFRDGRIAAQRNYDCFEPW